MTSPSPSAASACTWSSGTGVAISVAGRAPTAGRNQLVARAVDGPELVARAAVLAAWSALVAHDFLEPRHHHHLLGALAGWTVMTVAMMGPAVLPAVRHVTRSSLRWRRRRAAGEFAAVYLALWVGLGAAALTLASWIGPSARLVAGGLLVAAVWQVTPQKRRSLWSCHRAVPFPPSGIRATVGCARFGVIHGLACIGSCWPLMTVMAVAPAPHVVWAAPLTTVVLHERRARHPRQATRRSAICLAIAAVVVAVVGA